MKKGMVWATVLLLVAMVAIGCAESADGVYTGTSRGYRGDVTVEVKIEGDAIAGIQVTEQSETAGIGGRALAVLPERVLEAQTIAVDNVSGATVTTAAFRNAMTNALKEAGALERFSAPMAEVEHTEETIEVDVVVAGSGVAGEAAALSAAEAGASVLLLEKVSIIGGTTNASGGAVMGTMSYMNEERGDESVELAQWWYARGEEKVNYDQLLFVTQQSGQNVNWLMDLGWTPVLGTGGDSIKEWSHRPDDGTGNRLANGGYTVVDTLNQAYTKLGGVTMVDTAVTQLLTDDEGKVMVCRRIESLIRENAQMAQNQEACNRRMEALVARCEKLKSSMAKARSQIMDRAGRSRNVEAYLQKVSRTEPLTVFDESVFTGNGGLRDRPQGTGEKQKQRIFRFKDGTEIPMTM